MPGSGSNLLQGNGLYTETEITCGSNLTGVTHEWDLNFNSVGEAAGSAGDGAVSAGDGSLAEAGSINKYQVGKQGTFSLGVDLSALGYGVSVSSQDGWGVNAYLTYAIGSTDLPICGVNNYPNATNPSAGRLQVH
jgi:hypothetical protein